MRKFPRWIGLFMLCFLNAGAAESQETQSKVSVNNIQSFTGKVSKNKVRMRINPSLDGPIAKELSKGELLLVVGETDEFYAVKPPTDLRGYIFRTYVLDNAIEGNRVNVRLAPNTESPVIGQLNTGDAVEGIISPLSNKWLEIAPPATTRFFVAKEYLEKVGDANYIAKMARRRDEVNQLLQAGYQLTQQEFQKHFPDIQLNAITANYQTIIRDYSDFTEQAARAAELLEEANETYLHKKIAYLEAKAESQISKANNINSRPAFGIDVKSTPSSEHETDTRNLFWQPYETSLFQIWSQNNSGSQEDFYRSEKEQAVVLRGIIEPYSRSVKNKPGDYILINPDNQLPLAFLYSTRVNLNDKVGKTISVEAVERPNNHFAYRAYYVLDFK